MTDIRHVATGMRRDPFPYAKIAPMMQCAMGAIYPVMHVYCTYFNYSHSIVAGGLDVMSYTTRLTPGTSATMRLDTRASTS